MPEPEMPAPKDTPAAPDRPDGLPPWARSLPALIASITALVTAIAAIRKPPDTTATESAYQEMQKTVAELKTAVEQNHHDLDQLHGFLEGYLAARSPHPAGHALGAKEYGPPEQVRTEAGATPARRPTQTPDVAPATAPLEPMPLPDVGPKPKISAPPAFDEIIRKSQTSPSGAR